MAGEDAIFHRLSPSAIVWRRTPAASGGRFGSDAGLGPPGGGSVPLPGGVVRPVGGGSATDGVSVSTERVVGAAGVAGCVVGVKRGGRSSGSSARSGRSGWFGSARGGRTTGAVVGRGVGPGVNGGVLVIGGEIEGVTLGVFGVRNTGAGVFGPVVVGLSAVDGVLGVPLPVVGVFGPGWPLWPSQVTSAGGGVASLRARETK